MPRKTKPAAAEPERSGLRIEWKLLDEVIFWDANPKLHDEPALRASIRRYGFRDAPIYDATLGALVAGNGRTLMCKRMRDAGEGPPLGVREDKDGAWLIPVQMGVDSSSLDEATAFAIDHNNLTMGPGFTAIDSAKLWSGEYVDLLKGLPREALPISVGEIGLTLIGEVATPSAAAPTLPSEAVPPDEFASYNEGIATEYGCPKCGYEWSGKPK